jgi:hypothetical protein
VLVIVLGKGSGSNKQTNKLTSFMSIIVEAVSQSNQVILIGIDEDLSVKTFQGN